jgi:hypothetical protein
MKCAHCGTRLRNDEFRYRDMPLCCECMSALCSWFLDGGMAEVPELFADLVQAEP